MLLVLTFLLATQAGKIRPKEYFSNTCVKGIVDKPRYETSKIGETGCAERAWAKGVSYVWSKNSDCYLYKSALPRWGMGQPTDGVGFWQTCALYPLDQATIALQKCAQQCMADVGADPIRCAVDCGVETGVGEEEGSTMAYQSESSAPRVTFVHMMAAFGFAVTAYGAFRHYVK